VSTDPPTEPPAPVVRNRAAGRTRAPRRAAAALGLLGTIGALVWIVTGPAVDVATTTGSPSTTGGTPLASLRRVPQWATATVAERALSAAVGPVTAYLPDASCLVVRDAGRTVVARDPDEVVVPASNLKPLTATAAVELLGADTRAATTVVAGSAPAGGVIRGDLTIVGGGDPVLTTAGYEPYEGIPRELLTSFESLADAVAATGIREVTGSIVGDDTRYDDVRTAPGWRPGYLIDAQVAPLSALVVDDGAPSPATVDPATQAASVMTALLQARGVRVAGAPRRGVAPDGATELARVESPTVAQLAEELVRFSDNTTAELLVKEIGRRVRGEGSTAAGTSAVLEWARSAGLPVDGAVVVDGSGLSRDNRLSCSTMVAVLERSGPDGPLAGWLARPGRAGTLDDRMVGTELADRVRAKTGSLDGVRSLSGWLDLPSGRVVAFAVGAVDDGTSTSAELESIEERILAGTLGYPAVPDPAALRPRTASPS
jgi:D-alanyl-D-alanine carboxypeptidase/D-alanyl-D-alanine-endopeptidase (penicillin-binding protein 4)